MQTAKTQVPTALRQIDPAYQHTRGIVDMNAVQARLAHAPAAPEIAFDINLKPICCAVLSGVYEYPAVAQRTISVDVKSQDLLGGTS